MSALIKGKDGMDFDKAKSLLVEYALGSYDQHENITTWEELLDAALEEARHAEARAETLRSVANSADLAIEEAQFTENNEPRLEMISGRFENLTSEQQEQARAQWDDATPGDGYLYKNNDGISVKGDGQIYTRSYVA